MRMAYEFCLATAAKQIPSGPDWIHEVKHDVWEALSAIRLLKHRARWGARLALPQTGGEQSTADMADGNPDKGD